MTFSPTLIISIICIIFLLIGGHLTQALRAAIDKLGKAKVMRYGALTAITLVGSTAYAASFVMEITKM